MHHPRPTLVTAFDQSCEADGVQEAAAAQLPLHNLLGEAGTKMQREANSKFTILRPVIARSLCPDRFT